MTRRRTTPKRQQARPRRWLCLRCRLRLRACSCDHPIPSGDGRTPLTGRVLTEYTWAVALRDVAAGGGR